LLIGKPPFETPEVNSTYGKIKACKYSFPENVQINEHAKNLIQKILVLEPQKRPTLDEILAHPYLTSCN
jgi:polo-like kinase 1